MSLRHRSALPSEFAASQDRSFFPKRDRRAIAQATRWVVEALEKRVLLTTLHGGDTFVFFGAESTNVPFVPEYQRITVIGNRDDVSVEVIGSNVNGNTNTVDLENLPGQLNGVDVNGGFALPPGATPIGDIGNVLSLAVDPTTGQMYGITITQGSITYNLPTTPPTTQTVANNDVNLVSIDKTTGAVTFIQEISQQILTASGIQVGLNNQQAVLGVPAMTFIGGTLFIAAGIGGTTQQAGGQAVLTATDHLVELTPNNPGAVGGSLGTFGGAQVTALAGINGELYATSKNQLIQLPNPGNTDLIGAGFPITPAVNGNIAGLAQAADGKVFITTNNGGPTSELFWINPVMTTADQFTGTDAIDYGPLPVTAVVNNGLVGNGTGANPGDMAYDPTTDTLFSFDVNSHQLFSISQLNRVRSLSIFQVYVAASNVNDVIITSEANVPTTEAGANNFVTPYGNGLAAGLRVINAQSGVLNLIAAPAGSGTATIGSVTRHIIPNATNDTQIPLLTSTVAATNGATSSPFQDAPYRVGETLTAGVVSAPGTTIGGFLDSGPVMGEVELAGNIDTFYAGWLITGDTNGEPGLGLVNDPGNFTVAGDLRNLLVSDAIGTDSDAALTAPTYVTAFDMHVGGTIGRVQTFDSLIGNVDASHSPTAQNLSNNEQESEVRTGLDPNPFGEGILSGTTNAIFNNDTFATAQDVGTVPTSAHGTPSAVVVDGNLQADGLNDDVVDYYGVALLAGQTITLQVVQLIPPPLVLDLGVFNPDGDLVASDYNNVDPGQTQEQQFRFTADRPGVYRFAVASAGDAFFTAAGPLVGDTPYQLTIQNVGDVGIGGIVALNNILDNVNPFDPQPSFGVTIGDLGALSAGATIMSTNGGDTVNVPSGNLRDINAGSIGLIGGPAPFDTEVQVPQGTVGLVSANNAGGTLLFNYPLLGLPPAIGGDFQLLNSAGDFDAKLIANGSIGVIRTGDMEGLVGGAPLGPPIFHVNDDNSTTPGTIDLIDDAGDFGTIAGGPEITTGPGGNVGYIRVAGEVFRDGTFGGGEPEATLYQPGESATLTDDSGAQVVITPTGTPSVPPTTGTVPSTTGSTVNPNLPQLSIIGYGIEGSGGVAIINITSTGGVTITTSGLESGQTVQIGEIDALGLGQGLVQTVAKPTIVNVAQPTAPTTGTTTATTTAPTFYTAPDTAGPQGRTLPLPAAPMLNPNSQSPLDVILNGSAQTGVFEVFGGFMSSIQNNTTGGEIVNTIVASIGTISSKGTIGMAKDHTGAALNGQKPMVNPMGIGIAGDDATLPITQVATSAFPYIDGHNAIIEETVLPGREFEAWGIAPFVPALGTIITTPITTTVTGSNGTTTTTITSPVTVGAPENGIVNIIAGQGLGNIDVLGAAPQMFGSLLLGSIGSIQGSILGPVFADGSIHDVELGSLGIAPSGTGANTNAGIYADAQIGLITNSVPADIRGTIASTTGLSGIRLTGGSIIFCSIEDDDRLNETVELPVGQFTVPTFSPITNPTYDVGNISVIGNGGIIGVNIGGDHIGHVDVQHGFGILDTFFSTLGDGTLAGLVADGYGIRTVTFDGGASVGSIVAAGNGRNISTQVYSPDVRYSETDAFDPFSSFQPNALTDINVFTGATAQTPQVPGDGGFGTDTGVIADSDFVGSRDLGTVRAFQIRATDPELAPTTFNFANSIGAISSLSSDDGLSVITGRMKSFHPGGNIDNLTFQVAGPIKTLNIGGDVTGASIISASGRNGNIGTLHVAGTMEGSITAARKIQKVVIGGNLTGVVSAKQINSVNVGGNLNGGNLDVQGNVNKLVFAGDLGLPSETLTIHGSVKLIQIGGNLNANLDIEGNLGKLLVGQSVLAGTLTNIDSTLNLLTIDGDVQAGATIQAALIKHTKILGLNQGTIIGA